LKGNVNGILRSVNAFATIRRAITAWIQSKSKSVAILPQGNSEVIKAFEAKIGPNIVLRYMILQHFVLASAS